MKIITKIKYYATIKIRFLRNLYNLKEHRKKLSFFKIQFNSFLAMEKNTESRFLISKEITQPCLNDATGNTFFDTHYIYHLAWAARKLKEINPSKHVDISSSLHFSTIISSYIPTEFYDYRPANIKLDNLTMNAADLVKLPFESNSIESLSCMHTVEHIGLGRYGDKLDYDGDLKAISELQRVLSKNGNLLFVVPIGKPRIVFNAHRIYGYQQILDLFDSFELCNYSLIPDNAENDGIIENATKELSDKQNYGCGCFLFKKI